ncbi:MAG TPA: reverse transcriptase-like protein [Candidatus Saccharimonadales bacterium]|nr:reverse transcriptase-like protein [Candidatus Saccharimonadales bacterium]
MKKLKFKHELAQRILSGDKTTTWRMFDDKDLTVNDNVEVIDRVDPDKPQTWRVIGTATLTQVIEKRLREVDAADSDGHETYASPEEMLKAYQGYYGANVSLDTPLKVIHFSFTPKGNEAAPTGKKGASTTYDRIKIFADGGSRGNPGPSSSGYVLMDQDENIIVDEGVYLGVTTNNQAEYRALKFALEEAKRLGVKDVDVYMDSLLVINQMKGVFKVKNRDLWPIHEAIKKLCGEFEKVRFTHVPRELNKLADAAVNRALDAHADGLPS